jgi:hypothetical protein
MPPVAMCLRAMGRAMLRYVYTAVAVAMCLTATAEDALTRVLESMRVPWAALVDFARALARHSGRAPEQLPHPEHALHAPPRSTEDDGGMEPRDMWFGWLSWGADDLVGWLALPAQRVLWHRVWWTIECAACLARLRGRGAYVQECDFFDGPLALLRTVAMGATVGRILGGRRGNAGFRRARRRLCAVDRLLWRETRARRRQSTRPAQTRARRDRAQRRRCII